MDLKPVPFRSPLSAYEQQAQSLLAGHRAADPAAIDLFHHRHPRFLDEKIKWRPKFIPHSEIRDAALSLDDRRGHARRSRGDDGCLQFDVMLPNGDDEHVFLVEKWRDQETLDEHAKGPMPGATYRDWIVGRKVARGALAN